MGGLEEMRQKTLASVTSVSSAPRDQSLPGHQQASTAGPSTLLQGLQEKTWDGVQKARQAANDRVEIAKAGKKILEDGGECAARVVVAKEALNDAANIDRELAERVQSAIDAFDASVAKLGAVRYIEGVAELAKEHQVRASEYRQIASMLEVPLKSLEMNPAERDALALVKVRNSCGTLQSRTNEGFDAVKTFAFSGCAREWNRECRDVDRECRRMRTVCA